jgi:hypothetical protein
VKSLWILLFVGTMMLAACGGAASGGSQHSATLSGNWQFSLANPASTTTTPPEYPPNQPYGLQGGFLLQTNGSVTGQAVYSVSNFSQTGSVQVCNSGSATITAATFSGNTVNLTYVAGSQTFTLTNGILSTDGSTMSGTYTATQGTAFDGTTVCGIGTSASGALPWTASLVPSLTGSITGSFHSMGSVATNGQDFLVSGYLNQGENIGASNATVTGSLSFIDPTTGLSDYPCFTTASIDGTIGGNYVILQLFGTNGSNIGQIGGTGSSSGNKPVTFTSTQGGVYILSNAVTPGYAVNTTPCPGNGLGTYGGDQGNICLALNNSTACQEPITLSPAVLTFPAQLLGSPASSQTITLTNNSSSTLDGLTLIFNDDDPATFSGLSDFDGLPSFTAADTCAAGGPSLPKVGYGTGTSFNLGAGVSCTISVYFSPQESCLWLPLANPSSGYGVAPEYCPNSRTASLQVASPVSADNDKSFVVPIAGIGQSALQPSTPELDFSAEAVGETSQSQLLTFTNYSAYPVQILPGSSSAVCTSTASYTLPHLTDTGSGASPSGLWVVGSYPGVTSSIALDNSGTSITYYCDVDSKFNLSNFQISSDSCMGTTGTTLAPGASCSLEIAYVPQPNTTVSSTPGNPGLDYFLELNTLPCSVANGILEGPSPNNPCEIDSGRFPVELKANAPSPLRMLPAAGLDFGTVKAGQTSIQQTITLLNDPAQNLTVNFTGKVAVVSGKYSETDNCPYSLASGASCTLAVTFNPTAVGFAPGTLTMNYMQVSGTSNTLGNPQIVYLRGTGQ